MKKYILKSLFVSVLCMLAASCQDTEFAEAVDSSKAQVMFSIAMDSPAARSRANWGQDYSQTSDLGDEYDNRIDLDQFIVKIEADGKTYNVTDIIKWKEGESNEHKFVGIVKTQNDENVGDITLQKAKISVYANMGTDANANFASMTFDQDAENIPMWGALTVENLKFAPGKRTSVDDIYLLRAMAKLQVTLGDAAIEKGYTLTKASLNKFNLTGFNMPTGYAGAESTMALDMEGVLNENTTNPAGGVTELTEATEDGKGWVIYLPEISNTTDSELKMLLTFSNGDNEKIETEVSVKDYTTANTSLVNIVRNHWYKYVIEDIVNAKPVVKYETLDWEPININVGGEGFLALSTDLVEIYNANTGQLKFTSSSPITITRADVYEHKDNGEIVKRKEINKVNPINAYYINKFGVLTQLSTDDNNPESVILANTSAIIDGENQNVLDGTITINSPFVGDATASEDVLKNDSHYDTIRYLEYIVTNEDGLWTTFRVMQYPPVVITNVKGYFSYRSDYVTHSKNDDGIPTHYLHWKDNYKLYSSGFNVVHIHEHDDSKHDPAIHDAANIENYQKIQPTSEAYCWGKESETTKKYKPFWEEIINGQVSYTTVHPVGRVYRYYNANGYDWKAKMGVTTEPSLGPTYEVDGKLYKKHYTGNIFYYFWSRYVDESVSYEGDDKGKSLICCMSFNQEKKEYTAVNDIYPVFKQDFRNQIGNSRMYHIRTTTPGDYILGYPKLEDDNGNETMDPDKGHTVVSEENKRIVSPSFMVASELGKTFHLTQAQYEVDGVLDEPLISFFYDRAVNQCKYYVEATYVDVNNDGVYTDGVDKVYHYDDWRLPTEAEVEMIKYYQTNSRAMDIVMQGEKYICATPGFLSKTVGTESGHYMRCVRDVKGNENH